jgi:MFS family permease
MRPGPLVLAAVVLAVAGTYLAGIAAEIPLWLVALALAALGIGIANTASLGLLVDAVPVERVATAMVVWSQIGILGYLLGPLTGGIVADKPRLRIHRRGPPSGRRSRRLPPSHLPARRQVGRWTAQ